MHRVDSRLARLSLAVAVLTLPSLAFAHEGHEHGFVAALAHPFTGWDHLLAMLLVGALAARHAGRSGLAMPAGFVAGAAVGALAALLLPAASGMAGALEPAILGSVALLGLAAALAWRAPIALAATACASFGAVHGLAHGIELAGDAIAVLSGMLVATAVLHAAGFIAVRASAGHAPWLARLVGVASSVMAIAAIARVA